MNFTSSLNEKMKKLDWMDVALMKISCFAFGALLVMWFPSLLGINILWIITLWIILAIRPVYRFFK